jgi:hypothetical protein
MAAMIYVKMKMLYPLSHVLFILSGLYNKIFTFFKHIQFSKKVLADVILLAFYRRKVAPSLCLRLNIQYTYNVGLYLK